MNRIKTKNIQNLTFINLKMCAILIEEKNKHFMWYMIINKRIKLNDKKYIFALLISIDERSNYETIPK